MLKDVGFGLHFVRRIRIKRLVPCRHHPALFARAGATAAARATLTAAGGMLIDLPMLFADLAEA